MEYKRYADESERAYIYRICSDKDAIGTWYDVRDILNRELGHDWTESAYRKQFQMGKSYFQENEEKFIEDKNYLEEVQKEREKMQRERYKLQTEKLEYNRWLREHARDELFEEKVIEAIEAHLNTSPPPLPLPVYQGDRCAILNIADIHFGADFKIYGVNDEVLNEYSPEIFYSRMERLFSELLQYLDKYNFQKIKVFNLGDSLDGFLRTSQIWTLRYGVVDSAIVFGDFMGTWLHELSKHKVVEYYQTSGNHGELRLLDGKKGGHLNDNIEKVTGHIIKLHNKDNPNFKMIENKSGFIFTEAAGFNILGCHGEVKSLPEAIKDYSNIYNVNVDYIIAGHKHHTSFDNCGTKKGCIGVGSVIGSNDYSITLRRTSDSTASLIIFEENKGKVDEHTFVLN